MKLPDFSIGPRSQTLVVLVIVLISLLKNVMSYSFVFGGLSTFAPGLVRGPIETGWSLLRFVTTGAVVVLWLAGHKRGLFRASIIANIVFTVGLILTTASLVSILFGFKASGVGVLLFDVLLLATANILVFSIWYWIIDPPGIDEDEPLNTPWDFLFPHRSNPLPGYEHWEPRYLDYLFLAFTTTFAFSPTDTLPLTRRAKLLMMLQATISVVTLVVVVGTAVNVL